MKSPPATALGAHEAARLAALIREQAAAEVEQVASEARQREEHIRRAAEAEARAIRVAAEREGESRGRRRAARLLARAEAGARMEWLRARQGLIDDVIERSQAELAQFATMPSAGARLADLIREALSVLPDGPVRARVPASYEGLLREALRENGGDQRLAVQPESGSVPGGGVVVETENGRLRFDNSFAARIRRERDRFHRVVAACLSLLSEQQSVGSDG